MHGTLRRLTDGLGRVIPISLVVWYRPASSQSNSFKLQYVAPSHSFPLRLPRSFCVERMVDALVDSFRAATSSLSPSSSFSSSSAAAHEDASSAVPFGDRCFVSALAGAYQEVDSEFLAAARAARPPVNAGTTAITAVIAGDVVHVANAGDSRAVLVRSDGSVVHLSSDHKPCRPDEVARIVAAGGKVLFHGVWRVCGVLGVSRAIGDRVFKPNIVTCQPEVATYGPLRRIRRNGRSTGSGAKGNAVQSTATNGRSTAAGDDHSGFRSPASTDDAAAPAAPAVPSSSPASPKLADDDSACDVDDDGDGGPYDLALVLASDGLFDTISSEDTGLIVAQAMLAKDIDAQSDRPVIGNQPKLLSAGGERASQQHEPGRCSCDGRSPAAEAAALRLVSSALERGSFDNVTALCVDLRRPVQRCRACAT